MRSWKWWWALGVVVVPLAAWGQPTPPDVWDAGAYEVAPAATDPVGQGDDHLRALKVEARERAEVEHKWGTPSGSPDNGLHYEGSGRCFYASSAPTVIEEAAYNNTGGATSDVLTATEPNGAQTIGEGRCWVDSDDLVLYIHSGTAWVPVHPLSTTNLVPNNHFSGDDNASTTYPTGGWVALGATTPTIAYAAKPTTEGVGLEVQVTASGAVNEGIQYTFAGLRASGLYWMVGRVQSAVGDTCTLRLNTSGGTDVAVTNTGTAAIEVLNGLVTLDGTPTGEILELESDDTGDVCEWSSVGLYEVAAPMFSPAPGPLFVTDSDSPNQTALAAGATEIPNVDPELTIPADAGLLIARGDITLMATGSNSEARVQLEYDANGGADTTCRQVEILLPAAPDNTESISLECVIQNATPGAEYQFRIQVIEDGGSVLYGDPDAAGNDTQISIDLLWLPLQ